MTNPCLQGAGKAPGLMGQFSESPKWPLIAGHNVLNAHAAAVAVYRREYQQAQGGKIAITNNMDWNEPKTSSPADVAAAQRYLEFQLGWFADPIFGGAGNYPASMRAILGDQLPTFTDAQKKLLNGSADIFGLNSCKDLDKWCSPGTRILTCSRWPWRHLSVPCPPPAVRSLARDSPRSPSLPRRRQQLGHRSPVVD